MAAPAVGVRGICAQALLASNLDAIHRLFQHACICVCSYTILFTASKENSRQMYKAGVGDLGHLLQCIGVTKEVRPDL